MVARTIEGQTLHDNRITLSDDPRLAEIQALMHDCKLAALEAEARTAKALALKAAKAVETIEIKDMDGITQAQTYRSNLWPRKAVSLSSARTTKRFPSSQWASAIPSFEFEEFDDMEK